METTQGTPSPQEGTAGEAPKAISLDDVNKAITARLSGFEKKITGSLGEMFATRDADKAKRREEKAQAKATRQAEKAAAKAETEKTGAAGAAGGGKTETKAGELPADLSDHPTLKQLKKELSENKNKTVALERENAEAKAKATKLEAENRDRSLRAKIAEHLGEHGVDASRAKYAVGHLVDATKRVRANGDAFEFVSEAGDAVDLKEGIQQWVASEDAKIFLPPRGAAGSGERTNSNTARGGALTGADRESALKRTIAEALMSRG